MLDFVLFGSAAFMTVLIIYLTTVVSGLVQKQGSDADPSCRGMRSQLLTYAIVGCVLMVVVCLASIVAGMQMSQTQQQPF